LKEWGIEDASLGDELVMEGSQESIRLNSFEGEDGGEVGKLPESMSQKVVGEWESDAVEESLESG
jgi:hypothetical protein